MADEMREALEAAYEQHTGEPEQEETGVQAVDSEPEGDGDAPQSDSGSVDAEIPGVDAVGQPEGDSEPGTETEERRKPKFELIEESGDDTSDAEPAADSDAEVGRAPVGWRAGAREHWGELPEAVREEVQRRELEVQRALSESDTARQFRQQFDDVVAPFQGLIAAQNSDPLSATRALMQAAAGLQMGTQQQKAALVADMITRYGVDVETLDGMLSGETNGADPGQAQLLQAIDQRLAPVQRFMGDMQTAQRLQSERTTRDMESEIDAFAAKNEFFEDVREDMALLTRAAADQGRPLSLQDAYDKAVALNPEVAKIVAHRAARAASQANSQSLEQKKAAAASVKGEQRAQVEPRPDDMRGQLSAAWDAMEAAGGR